MGLFFFVLACILLGVGLAAAFAGSTTREHSVTAFGVVMLLIGLTVMFFDSFTTVAARGVAVQTAFGKVQGRPLGPGWHWVAPWNSVEEFDASVQTLKFYQDERKDDGDCLTVRLGNSNTACVDVTTQWNINPSGDVNDLYLQYKTFDNVHDNLVKRQLGSALNEIFGTYDPLAAIGQDADRPTVNTKDLQDRVKTALQRDLGSAIRIDSVTIPIVHFDGPTEDRLRSFQQAKADTRIAAQRKLTADQQALTNQALAAQTAIHDPGVQYQNCLDLIDRLAKESQLGNLPPTFTCGQGTGGGAIIQTK